MTVNVAANPLAADADVLGDALKKAMEEAGLTDLALTCCDIVRSERRHPERAFAKLMEETRDADITFVWGV